MHAGQFVLLITAFTLAGCDRITGAANQRILDSEAIGYSCRVSLKPPEDCIKENDTMIPSSILDGWRVADKDIQAQLVDPSMGKKPPAPAASAPAAVKPGEPAPSKKITH